MCTFSDTRGTSSHGVLRRNGGHPPGVKDKQMRVDGQPSRRTRSNAHRNAKRASVANPLNLLCCRGAPAHEPRSTAGPALLRVLAMPGDVGSTAFLKSSRALTSKLAASMKHRSCEHCRERRPPERTERSKAECFTSAATAGF